ncbi:hypothetical protein GCM10010430_50180 [Kitasatospora cystarginea]|uniref:Uncharacterized protein n=1 Tax=Kitasatospora cystarginea TaxID=58350 RepID=A0ABN3EJE4_9ACTN
MVGYEAHAPGLRALVTRWSAVRPAGLAAANRNAVRGDPYGGSADRPDPHLVAGAVVEPPPRRGTRTLAHRCLGSSRPRSLRGSGQLVTRQLLGRAAQLRGLLAAGRTVLRRSLARARFDRSAARAWGCSKGHPRNGTCARYRPV